VLVVEAAKDERLELSARNLPGVNVIRADSLNVVDILDADILVITQPSIGTMAEVYA
jgi:large subunit ribosomal protein L4